MEELAVL